MLCNFNALLGIQFAKGCCIIKGMESGGQEKCLDPPPTPYYIFVRPPALILLVLYGVPLPPYIYFA